MKQTKNKSKKETDNVETNAGSTVNSTGLFSRPLLKNSYTFSRNQLLLFILIFAAIGGYILYRSFAASGTAYTMTSSLADNTTISGKLTWTVTVTPQPYQVDFYVDGVKDAHSELYAPYQYKGDPSGVLDTTLLSNGKHTFQEVAIYDSRGSSTIPAGYLQNGAIRSSIHTLTVSNGAVTTPPTVGSTAACTKTLLATDSLINTYNAAHAGDVLCLPADAVYNVGAIDFRNAIGTSGAPLTITSQDRSHPATILGRIITHPPVSYLTLSYLKLDGKNPTGGPSPTIGSDYISLVHDDIYNENTAICINSINDSTYGTAHHTLIDQNRIHNCGRLPAGSTNNDHGIYDIAFNSVITNNFIYDNTDRGIQLRGAQGANVHNNVSDGNGEGIIFGELGAANNNVYNNIFSNSVVRYNIETYWGGNTPGTGNILRDSCVWTTRTDGYSQNNSIMPGISGLTITNVKFANPMYTNAAAKDFSLQAGSACNGYGVQAGIKPGIN